MSNSELRSDEEKTKRLRDLQSRRSALIHFGHLVNTDAVGYEDIAKAIKRISGEIDELAPLRLVK